MASGSKFYYSNNDIPETWTEEEARLKIEYVDCLFTPNTLVIEISDPKNLKQSTYSIFRRVKLVERESGQTLFLGRIEFCEPEYSGDLGQCLKVTALDYLSDLTRRFVGKDYSNESRISDVVTKIITDYIYSGNISTSGIEASSQVITKGPNYIDLNKTGLEAIYAMAMEDKWDSTPTGYGYDFYVDDKQIFNYQKRGKYIGVNASTGIKYEGSQSPALYGLTIGFRDTETAQVRAMFADYSFAPSYSQEIITRITVHYQICTYDDEGNLIKTEAKTVTATNSSLEDSLKIISEKHIFVNEAITDADAQNIANALLKQYGNQIPPIKGTCSVRGYPQFVYSSIRYFVKSSHLVHVHNSLVPSVDNTDMLVTKITYKEPESISIIELIEFGKGYYDNRYDLSQRLTDDERLAQVGYQQRYSSNYFPGGDTIPPSDPTGLTLSTGVEADADGHQIAWLKADWTANTEEDMSHYIVRYKAGATGSYSYDSTPTNSIKLEPVIGNVTYYVSIAAKDKSGNQSLFCSEQTIVTASDTTPPGSCSSLTATGGLKRIFLQWANPSDKDLAYIEVLCSLTNNRNNGSTIAEILSDYFVHDGISDNTTQYYWIRAWDTSGNYSSWYPSSPTGGVSATTLNYPDIDPDAPSIPTGLALSTGTEIDTDGGQQVWIKATWNANTESDLAYYTIKYWKTSGYETYVDAPTNSITLKPIVGNVTYYVQVQAIDQLNKKSAFCSSVSIPSAKDTTAPSPPSNLSVTAHFAGLVIKWTNPSDLDFSYTLIRRSNDSNIDNGVDIAKVSTEEYFDNIGTYSTTRYYWVKAYDTSGNSSSWVGPASSTTGYVESSDIDSFAIDASKLFINIPILSGDSWTNNSPSAEYIAWNAHTLYRNGVSYSISASNTNKKYVYWKDLASSYSTSDSHPADALSDWNPGEDYIIAANVSGIVQKAWNALCNAVIGTAFIKDAAIETAKINDLAVTNAKIYGDLDAGKITVGTLLARPIQSATSGARVEIFPDAANIGIRVYDDASAIVFRALVGGTDVGDVQIGDYANNKGLLWDKSASTFYVKGAIICGDGSSVDGGYIISGVIDCSLVYIKSAATGQRIELTGSGIKTYDSSNNQRVQISNDGSGWFGASNAIYWNTSGSLTVSSANVSGALTAATISADKITAGTISSQTIILNTDSAIIKSSNFVSGTSGWQIKGGGNAEFNDVTVRGTIYASSGEFAGTLKATNIKAGSTLTVNGTISAAGGDFIIDSTGLKIYSECSYWYSGSTKIGYIGVGPDNYSIGSLNGDDLILSSDASLWLGGRPLYLDPGTTSDVIVYLNSGHSLRPNTADTGNLGSSSKYWNKIFTNHISATEVETAFYLGAVGLYPASANTCQIGTSTYYFYKMYANTYYGKNTTIQSFQNHDDLDLLKNIKVKDGSLDILSFPDEVLEDIESMETQSKTEEEVIRGINIMNFQSLLMGAILQLEERIQVLEKGRSR